MLPRGLRIGKKLFAQENPVLKNFSWQIRACQKFLAATFWHHTKVKAFLSSKWKFYFIHMWFSLIWFQILRIFSQIKTKANLKQSAYQALILFRRPYNFYEEFRCNFVSFFPGARKVDWLAGSKNFGAWGMKNFVGHDDWKWGLGHGAWKSFCTRAKLSVASF